MIFSILCKLRSESDILSKIGEKILKGCDRCAGESSALNLHRSFSQRSELTGCTQRHAQIAAPKYLWKPVHILLHISLTLPVNVAGGEHAFSKMKLIKSYSALHNEPGKIQ